MEILNDFFSETEYLSIIDILINIILAGIVALLVREIYIRFGKSLSNRKQFSSNFFLITVSTTLIVSIIQSSLALSLGLVGALSIVRFRNAIKEPEELAHLFFCIALGLGFGANKRLLAISAGLLIMGFIIIRSMLSKKHVSEFYNLNIVSSAFGIEKLLRILSSCCEEIALTRVDTDKSQSNYFLAVELKSLGDLEQCITELKNSEPEMKISFFPNRVVE